MASRCTQHLGYRDREYQVQAFRLRFRKNLDTKQKTHMVNCTLVAEDIAEISPWIMQGGPAEVFLRRRHFDDQSRETSNFKFCFHIAHITEYWEEFDRELGMPLLHFTFTAEAVTGIDNGFEQKLNDLLEDL